MFYHIKTVGEITRKSYLFRRMEDINHFKDMLQEKAIVQKQNATDKLHNERLSNGFKKLNIY